MLGWGVLGAVPVSNPAMAEDIDDIEVEFNVLSSERPKSFWASLFDNRADRKRPFDYLSGGMPDTMIYFAGLDAANWSFTAFGGAQWTPRGPGKDGFILRLLASEGIERYASGPVTYATQIGRAAILPGYIVHIGRMEAQFLAGPDTQADLFYTNGRANRWRVRFGLRAAADIWWEPTPELMLQTSLSGTTIDNGYTARFAAGWRIADLFWIGPEAAFASDFFSRQTRFGVHLTGLRTSEFEWSFAAGRVTDSFGRAGIYGRFGLVMRPDRAPFFEN